MWQTYSIKEWLTAIPWESLLNQISNQASSPLPSTLLIHLLIGNGMNKTQATKENSKIDTTVTSQVVALSIGKLIFNDQRISPLNSFSRSCYTSFVLVVDDGSSKES